MNEIDKKLDDLLQHHGVKGMHWGTRKDTRATRKRYNSYNKGMKVTDRSKLKKMSSSEARQKHLDERDSKWLAKVKDDKKIRQVSKRVTKEMKKVNKDLKKEFGGTGLKGEAKRALDGKLNAHYHKAMKDAYEEVIADHTHAVYKLSPTRTREVEVKALPDGTLKAVVVERSNPKLTKQRNAISKSANKVAKKEAKALLQSLLHADEEDEVSNVDGMFFLITLDEDGFPDEVIPPFDSTEDDESLKHYGVKGMHWGVRREGGAKGKIGQHVDSLRRERQWHKALREIHTMTTKEINTVAKRVNMENNLKRLSKTKMATKKDKEDYLRRDEMSDQELARKISRLQAKDALHKAVKDASKEQKEFGLKVARIGGSIGVKYAINKKVTPKDVYDAVKNPKSAGDQAKKDVAKEIMKQVRARQSSNTP